MTVLHDMFRLGLPVAEKVLRPIVVYVFLIVGLRLAGKRELHQVFARTGRRTPNQYKNLRAGVHAVDDFSLDGQRVPDVLADGGGLIIKQVQDHGLFGGGVGEADFSSCRWRTAIWSFEPRGSDA